MDAETWRALSLLAEQIERLSSAVLWADENDVNYGHVSLIPCEKVELKEGLEKITLLRKQLEAKP